MKEPIPICLRFPQYRDWYDAIRMDNLEEMKARLNSVEHKILIELINGSFKMENTEIKHSEISSKMALNTWHLVVTLCSEDSIKLFINNGVNIQGISKYKYNIIHSIILAAAFEPELEDALIEKYKFIVENISKDDTLKLLMAENDEGMRPLEFAMHNSLPGLFQGIVTFSFQTFLRSISNLCKFAEKVFVFSKRVPPLRQTIFVTLNNAHIALRQCIVRLL